MAVSLHYVLVHCSNESKEHLENTSDLSLCCYRAGNVLGKKDGNENDQPTDYRPTGFIHLML